MYAFVTSTKKFFQSVYLRKWTQLCKKEKLKYQVLAQWKGRKPEKKINVHILIQWTCRLHTTVLKGVSPKLPHELVYLAVASGLCCTKCLCCTKTKARGMWFDFHSCFVLFFSCNFFISKLKLENTIILFQTVMRIKPDMDMPRKKNVRFTSTNYMDRDCQHCQVPGCYHQQGHGLEQAHQQRVHKSQQDPSLPQEKPEDLLQED